MPRLSEPERVVETDRYKLILGDCRGIDFEGDLVIADPPYGIAHKSNGQLFISATPILGDESVGLALAISQLAFDLPLAMFFSPYCPLPILWRSVLTWNKGPQVGIGGDRETCWKRDFELIGVRKNRPLNGNRDSAILDFPADVVKASGHFCEKPVRLIAYLIEKLTLASETVFDPTMGSGTTGVACMRLGRKFVGCEINEHYFNIALERIEKERLNPQTIASVGRQKNWKRLEQLIKKG